MMKLIAFLMVGPTSHHHAMWRHPETENRFLEPAFWEHLARTLEAGKFDGLFFADSLSFASETVLAKGGQMSLLDPVPLIAMLSRVTSRIGLGLTISTSFSAPYGIARTLASLDHLSGGRVAWNVVTSAHDQDAQNFGLDALLPRTEHAPQGRQCVLSAACGVWASFENGSD